MEGSREALDAQQKLQQLWQGAPISQIANGAEISQPVSIFTRKKKTNQIPSAQCALQKTIPSKFKIIPKGVMRLRNQIPQLCRANICRLHKHRVYSTEHNAANDGLLFFLGFLLVFF